MPPEHLWQRKFIVLDTAFKKGAENDATAGVCFLETKEMLYWIDCFNEKLDFPELIKKTEEFYTRNNADFALVEDAASGQSLIQSYQRNVNFHLIPVKADRDKVSRAVASTPILDAGKLSVLFGWWNKMAISELCDFNECLDTPDNIVDAFGHGVNYIKFNRCPVAKPTSRKAKRTSKHLSGY